jgi:3-oxoacyl-[acyl-carrier protein] reductase
MRFKDKVALVTGAGRGIGRALAIALAQEGARVAVNDINPTNADETVAEIIAAGGEAGAWIADVSLKHPIQAMIDGVLERWGDVHLLINNAAIMPSGAILKMDEWAWDRTINVNLKGPFLMCQSVGRIMKESGGGAIVNIAAAAGRVAGLADRAAYVASKAGLIGFTHECAREFAAYHIRVNAVCPGLIDDASPETKTLIEDIPLGRLGRARDVVGMTLFLCSDDAAYITGQAINVDGGKVMS